MSQVDIPQEVKATLGKLTESVQSLRAERESADKLTRDELAAKIEAQDATIAKLQAFADTAEKHQLPGLELETAAKPGFSLFRCMQIAASELKNGGQRMGRDLMSDKTYGLEIEAIKQYASQTGQSWADGGILIPHVVQANAIIPLQARMSVGARLGVTQMSGMVGTMEWPVEGIDHIAYYVDSEAMGATTSSATTMGSKKVSPHLMGADTKLSWGMLTQTAGAMEQIANRKIARAFALMRDRMLIHGLGTDKQPLGLKLTPGVLTHSFSGVLYNHVPSDVGAGTGSQTITDALGAMYWKIQAAEYNDGAESPFKYAGQKSVGARMGRAKNAMGTNLFTGFASAQVGAFDGYPMVWSNQVGAPTLVDTGAELWFGDWSQMADLSWMDFRLRATEVDDDAKRARVTIIAHQSHDLLCLQPTAFCRATSLDV